MKIVSKDALYKLSLDIQPCLFIDASSGINPHHPLYQTNYHKLSQIYCFRAEKAHDVIARLQESGSFKAKHEIKAILIYDFTALFTTVEMYEVEPLLQQLLSLLEGEVYISLREHQEEPAKKVMQLLSTGHKTCSRETYK